jgi:hypothetical protein
MENLRERLVNGGDFAELARLYSQDGSAAKGGDLGWISPGDTVPEFERRHGCAEGQGSQRGGPESPFGMHLIQVIERRQRDVSDERKRATARQALRERKLDEAYQDWLRQIRDRAYVEISTRREMMAGHRSSPSLAVNRPASARNFACAWRNTWRRGRSSSPTAPCCATRVQPLGLVRSGCRDYVPEIAVDRRLAGRSPFRFGEAIGGRQPRSGERPLRAGLARPRAGRLP